MRNLKYALLGLLNQKELTGYEIMKQFESGLCEFWSAKHSQIYPELKKLTDEGCIEFDIEITGTSLEKKVYRLTEKGKKDFYKWMTSNTDLPPTPKEISRLKVYFSTCLSDTERISLFEYQLMQHKIRLDHLQNNMKKFDCIPEKSNDAFGDYLVLLGAIMREESTCAWLEKCLVEMGQSPDAQGTGS